MNPNIPFISCSFLFLNFLRSTQFYTQKLSYCFAGMALLHFCLQEKGARAKSSWLSKQRGREMGGGGVVGR